jgi:hypothetical protein
MIIYIIIILLIVCVSIWLTLRGKKKKILAMPEGAAGFGHRDEKVTITFADGTTRESTWGEIADKVKEINGVPWWIEKKYDIVIGSIFCAVGLVATFLVYFLQMP